MDDAGDTLREKYPSLLAILAGVVLLSPLALLFALWFYLASLTEGVRLLVRLPFGKPNAGVPRAGLQKPHFTEIRSGAPTRK